MRFKLTLGQKILAGVGALAVGIVIVALLGFASQRASIDSYDRLLSQNQKKVDLINEVEIDRVLARRYERDFLLGEGDRFVGLHKNMVGDMKKSFDKINTIDKRIGSDKTADRAKLKKLLDEYSTAFGGVVRVVKEKGSAGSGAVGKLNEQGSRLEKEARSSSDEMATEAFALRSLEKDYLLGGTAEKERAVRKQLGRVNRVSQDNEVLGRVLAGYSKDFDRLVAADKEFVLAMGRLKETAHTLDTALKAEQENEFTAIAKERKAVRGAAVRNSVLSISISAVIMVVGILIGLLASRSVIRTLKGVIDRLTEASDWTSTASQRVAMASERVAGGTKRQAFNLEDTSSSLVEITSQTEANADSARQASTLSIQAKGAAQGGNEAMVELREAMGELSDSSQKVGNILKVIEEIAFQTNLLALNAAVEAARAGEHGRGFAVVAQEVRNLAGRSARAARDTTDLIEDNVGRTKKGVTVTEEVNQALTGITESVQKVADLLAEISAANEEQAQGVNQISTAISQMSGSTQQSAEAAEDTANASEQLSEQASRMADMVQELVELVNGSHHPRGSNAKAIATQEPALELEPNDAPSLADAAFESNEEAFEELLSR